MLLTDLFEARRNPHLNQRLSAYDVLMSYRNTRNLYVSFTREFKLGIYPDSKYDTPIGIYTYQMDRFWGRVERRGQLKGSFPFVSDAPYVNIIQSNSSAKMLHLQRYSDNDMMNDIDRLIDRYEYDIDDVDTLISDAQFDANYNSPGGRIWNITREIANRLAKNRAHVKWNKILRDLGYDYVRDDGQGIIHGNEPTQTMFLHIRALRVLDRVENK